MVYIRVFVSMCVDDETIMRKIN